MKSYLSGVCAFSAAGSFAGLELSPDGELPVFSAEPGEDEAAGLWEVFVSPEETSLPAPDDCSKPAAELLSLSVI